jgi:N-acetylglucosamine-6-phosphate deacetylase
MPEYVGPALVDLQVNGFAGVDFNATATTSDDVARALDAMEATGVGLCLPTIITSSTDHFAHCARTILGAEHPSVAGLHMEGPYISPENGFRGAHPLQHVCAASLEDFDRRQDAARGAIKLVTLAPEAPGAIALTEALADRGIRVAIGHTNASTSQIADAVLAGATLSTHLGNGCAVTLPRHPNVIWDQLADDRLMASLIVDGHHLPPSTVKVMVRAKTAERCLLVTDAVMAAGSPPGRYMLGDLEVELSPTGRVAAPGSPTLAGSSLTLDRAVAWTVQMADIPLTEAVAMASTQPATYLGIRPRGQVTITPADRAEDWRWRFVAPKH